MLQRFMKKTGMGRQFGILLVILALLPGLSGCFGTFFLTHTVHRINAASGNKFINTIIFWIFIILPVYKLAMLGDALIFNLIEFWTDQEFNLAQTTQPDGSVITLAPMENAETRAAEMTLTRDGKVVARQLFVQRPDGNFDVIDGDGQLCGQVIRDAEGNIDLTNAEGEVIRTLKAEELAELQIGS
ncbi:DUF3332 family protein [Candidatus Sumerlaeota bacterium]|nr:DUF3332 family protein [Candidatus Sumerlaeota bacterium]